MPVERAEEHPMFELGGEHDHEPGRAECRGAAEAALYRARRGPAGAAGPHHDHLDVFSVDRVRGTAHRRRVLLGVAAGDSVVVPI